MSRGIIDILQDRDGNTKAEAQRRVAEVKKLMAACNYDPIECEDIIVNELGLEMDYIFDLI